MVAGVFAGQVGCGSEVTTTGSGGGGTGGGSSTSTTTGAGGAGASGDCDLDADCPGGTCVEMTPGGWRVCSVPPDPATTCSQPGFDECCDTSECAMGTCLTAPVVPYCGGPQPLDNNVCAVDQCQSDAECGAGAFCSSGPMLGRKVRACIPAACRLDSDCAAEAGGACVPVVEPCCGASAGLFCVYPSDGCRSDADCPGGYCQPGLDRATCQEGGPACPA